MPIANVKLERISHNLPFNYHFDEIKPELVRSIRSNGILFPIWLIGSEKLVVVDGHRRLLAARELGFQDIPAKIYKIGQTNEVFFSTYLLNSANQPLSSVEKLKIVEIVQQPAFKSIQENILNNLGYLHIDNIADIARKVFDLPIDIQQYLHRKNIGMKSLENLLHYSYEEYQQWYRLFIELPFSVKEILTILEELSEICNRDGLDFNDIWKRLEIKNLVMSEYTPHQKVEKIKKSVERLRFPVLNKINSDFQNLSKILIKDFDGELKIQWDRTLENPTIFLNFHIKEKIDLDIIKSFFLKEKNIATFRKLLDLRENLP